MTLFHGGIVNVRRDEKNTIVSVLYQDLDKEDMDMRELLTLTAFKEDPNKLMTLACCRYCVKVKLRASAVLQAQRCLVCMALS